MRRCALGFLVAVIAPVAAALAQDRAAVRRFEVALHDGRVRVDELLDALAGEYGIDAGALPLPAVPVDLRGRRGSALLFGCRKLLLDSVRFRRDLAAERLVVTIDRERTRALRRDLRRRIADLAARLGGRRVDPERCELSLPAVLDPERPLVVLVHGIDSGPESLAELRRFLASEPIGCQVASLAYPDDASVERTAAGVAAALRALGAQPVAIVAHSLGGLVARAVVEDPELDPGNVETLVLIGTPNSGSDLAGLRVALEIAGVLGEAGPRDRPARELLSAVVAHWNDGLGEAGGDVWPGSVFLERLAARERNPRVAYHAIAGTRSLLRRAQVEALRAEVDAALRRDALTAVVRQPLVRWLGDLDELVDGEGDGAVGVDSASLDGVEVLLVPRDHVGLVRCRGWLGPAVEPAGHPVFTAVAGWLSD